MNARVEVEPLPQTITLFCCRCLARATTVVSTIYWRRLRNAAPGQVEKVAQTRFTCDKHAPKEAR